MTGRQSVSRSGLQPGLIFDNLAVTLCQADFDGNGTVDIGDFLQLLADWGRCE